MDNQLITITPFEKAERRVFGFANSMYRSYITQKTISLIISLDEKIKDLAFAGDSKGVIAEIRNQRLLMLSISKGIANA
tara:strand:- start:8091 stop:8327 length:237 start_codon:yes stop_codon:yes gene_type:complete